MLMDELANSDFIFLLKVGVGVDARPRQGSSSSSSDVRLTSAPHADQGNGGAGCMGARPAGRRFRGNVIELDSFHLNADLKNGRSAN